MNRQAFTAKLADLDFSMLVPDEFAQPPLPEGIEGSVNLESPTESFPLAMIASHVAAAFIAVAARPAYEDGTVEQWLRFLAEHFQITLGSVEAVKIGQTHDGIAAQGHQVQDGTHMSIFLVAFEDGARLVTVTAIAPAVLWPSFGQQMVQSVLSLKLDRPRGGTAQVMTASQAAAQS